MAELVDEAKQLISAGPRSRVLRISSHVYTLTSIWGEIHLLIWVDESELGVSTCDSGGVGSVG